MVLSFRCVLTGGENRCRKEEPPNPEEIREKLKRVRSGKADSA
jgi:hypothetical protein